ncbi:MAG TPA: alginate lyase family protein [Chloroflexota bacterium]
MIRQLGHRVAVGRQLIYALGPGWVAFRAGYALQQRSGLMRWRWPAVEWEQLPLQAELTDPALASPDRYLAYRYDTPSRFLFAPADRSRFSPFWNQWDGDSGGPVPLADAITRGEFRYFSHTTRVLGFPPDWHRNPFTGQQAPREPHWTEIGDYDHGDIKVIWELSRFSFAYDLVRAYWRTGGEEYAESFWLLVEDWRERNPPQRGPNWKCGQETSFRVMAWCFGLYGFLDAEATTGERVTMLAQTIAASGHRIEANLRYALSQRNNHGISEAMGLWTIGVLFPELRRAEHWRSLGREHLEGLGRDLIYDDGAFVQHSTNYHRVMLHDFLWALRLGDLNGGPFSEELRARVARAGEFLYQIQDAATGEAPFYGQNDGALILPLNDCDYHDLRPVVQATSYLSTGTKRYESGPWDEDLLWLFGPLALDAPVESHERIDVSAAQGGCFTIRSEAGFAFVRCPTFRDRPSQADALHVDLWWKGQNMAIDGGTFSYNAPPPWDNALSRTGMHNTIEVDGLDQMDRAGRFLWLPWLKSHVRASARSAGGHLTYWEGEHDGYSRLHPPVLHRRALIQLGGEHWLVLDALETEGTHDYRLHWLLPDLPFERALGDSGVVLDTPSGVYMLWLGAINGTADLTVVRGAADTPRGWRSRSYLEREPALSADLTTHGKSMRLWSVLGPPCRVAMSEPDRLEIDADGWCARVALAPPGSSLLASSLQLAGSREDTLEL